MKWAAVTIPSRLAASPMWAPQEHNGAWLAGFSEEIKGGKNALQSPNGKAELGGGEVVNPFCSQKGGGLGWLIFCILCSLTQAGKEDLEDKVEWQMPRRPLVYGVVLESCPGFSDHNFDGNKINRHSDHCIGSYISLMVTQMALWDIKNW